MTVVTAPATAPIDSVLRAVSSVDTCSTSTLKLLRALLGSDETDVTHFEKTVVVGATDKRQIRKGGTARLTKNGKPQIDTKLIVLECPDVPIQCLPKSKQLALATTTFNKTLKNLGGAVKAKQSARINPSASLRSPLKETQGRANDDSKPAAKKIASSSRSKSTLPERPRNVPPLASAQADSCVLRMTVGCARASLQCLRKLRKEDTARKEADIHLENGQLMLVSKLGSLGYLAEAIEETLALRTALDHVLDNRRRSSTDKSYPGISPCYSSLADCIEFVDLGIDGKSTELLISFQAQVLKLIAADKKSQVDDECLRLLSPASAKSPCQMVLRSVDRGFLSREKAALHLRSLSQITLSICPLISNGAEGTRPGPGSARTEFQMQCLALQFRCRWWHFAHHHPDFDKELWTPFKHSVVSLSRRAGQTQKADVMLVKSSLEQLLDLCKQLNSASSNASSIRPNYAVLNMLHSMVASVSSAEDASGLFNSLEGLCDDLHGLPAAIHHCRLASTTLSDVTARSEFLTSRLDDALKSLEGPLRGTSTEMNELFVQASKIRKAAAVRLAAISESSGPTLLHSDCAKDLARVFVKVIFSVLHFYARCLHPQNGSDSMTPSKRSQSVQELATAAHGSVRSALAAVHSAIPKAFVDWKPCAEALADCLSIANLPDDSASETTAADAVDECTPTTFVRVSNIYWLRYLKQKEMGTNSHDLLSTLRHSIEILQSRSLSEKKLGFFAIKIEKTAALYIELKRLDEARQALASAADFYIKSGALSTAAQRSQHGTGRVMRGAIDSPEFALGRLLDAHAKLLLQNQTETRSKRFVDSTELGAVERGLLLERQFVALGQHRVPEILRALLKEVAGTVIPLFDQDTKLHNQLRFLSEVLAFCSRNRLHPCQFLSEDFFKIRVERFAEAGFDHAESSGRFWNCLRTSVMLQWAFETDRPPREIIGRYLKTHSAALEQCKDWDSLESCINDPAFLIVQLQSVIDFSDMQGYSQLKLDALLLMRRLLKLQPGHDVLALLSCSAHIGLQYTRMGLTNRAGRTLALAESILAESGSQAVAALQLHLAYAEYMIGLSSCGKASEQLLLAQSWYETASAGNSEDKPKLPKVTQQKYLAQAAYVTSLLAFEQGRLDEAILHARGGVRTSIRQWAALEKIAARTLDPEAAGACDSQVDLLSDELSNMTLSTGQTPKNRPSKGAAFWVYVRTHFDGLLNLSSLSAHVGNFQDAVYYVEQAKKVGEAVASDALLCKASTLLAAHLAKAGHAEESKQMLDSCPTGAEIMECSAESAQVSLAIAESRLARLEPDHAYEAINLAQSELSKLQSLDSSANQGGCRINRVNINPSKEASGTVRKIATKPTKTYAPVAESTSRRPLDAQAEDLLSDELSDELSSAPGLSILVSKQQAEVFVLRCRMLIENGASEEAKALLSLLASMSRSCNSDLFYHVLQAKFVLNDALRLLQSDAVHSVLAESIIAFPTRQRSATSGVDPGNAIQRRKERASNTVRGFKGKKTVPKRSILAKSVPEPAELINGARDSLLSNFSARLSACSAALAHETSTLLSHIQLLSSVVSTPTALNSLQIACHLNAPTSQQWVREAASIQADVLLADKAATSTWPESEAFVEYRTDVLIPPVKDVDLQQKLISHLPPSWNVVSLVMSHDTTEMLLSRIRAHESPFLLRLPLGRTGSDDIDDEPYEFSTAKKELLDIITHANLTAHNADARSDKQGKKDWWAAREALDDRLKTLLDSVETLWFGGFRGIFSNQSPDEELLSRFSESLSRILDRQLPSRQKPSKSKEPRFQLHSNIIELFLALGHPDEHELCDAITDLLYFVIDVLQFQGERNAYDEIDFDIMVLEVSDALRSYFEAARLDHPAQTGHTILVLDKALHAFPWESLPCLEGRSVSRMPSLKALQERLSCMGEQNDASSGLHIKTRDGAYILNPSSDLTSTQETFQSTFSTALPDFTAIVNRAPSETEFEICLRDKDICLYFGHGSGAQYIRGRTIKRLKRCAVTFLMGCSSSKMVECGQFDPYGVPFNYLHAGSAAVVGTLWDVTDKDIDRFAMETFVNWGLLDRQDVKEDSSRRARKMKVKRQASKQKVRDTEKSSTNMGLDEAVAKARDACLLRYLNGAAPVIYGIPVYLDR
jgi:separase